MWEWKEKNENKRHFRETEMRDRDDLLVIHSVHLHPLFFLLIFFPKFHLSHLLLSFSVSLFPHYSFSFTSYCPYPWFVES